MFSADTAEGWSARERPVYLSRHRAEAMVSPPPLNFTAHTPLRAAER
ncbi:hypothetical protein [Streptomyces parvus]|nr:hypothetical protein [Streptomyces parvus]MCQ1579347.1 hypothetical protein [Streptomyces parvus]